MPSCMWSYNFKSSLGAFLISDFSTQQYSVQWKKCIPKNGGNANTNPVPERNPNLDGNDLGREVNLNGHS